MKKKYTNPISMEIELLVGNVIMLSISGSIDGPVGVREKEFLFDDKPGYDPYPSWEDLDWEK